MKAIVEYTEEEAEIMSKKWKELLKAIVEYTKEEAEIMSKKWKELLNKG